MEKYRKEIVALINEKELILTRCIITSDEVELELEDWNISADFTFDFLKRLDEATGSSFPKLKKMITDDNFCHIILSK